GKPVGESGRSALAFGGRGAADLSGVPGAWRLAGPRGKRDALPQQGEALLGSNLVCQRLLLRHGRRASGVLLDIRLAIAVGFASGNGLDWTRHHLFAAGRQLAITECENCLISSRQR